ncbi:MAG: DUF4157 domain-containing protein [Phaeodactylibacter sp.]|nr:DUF4157 domain-containing protein [Phaeodactylibacter sp.]
MKTHSSRTAQLSAYSPQQDSRPGQNSQKATPPKYGLDFSDRWTKSPTSASLSKSPTSSTSLSKSPTSSTNLPAPLQAGIEQLSGYSMDDVKVHYNSTKPAQLSALAYAQGTDIHLGPGQEKHLPHEAWHVAQQKQGRVRATRQLMGKININDDAGLEKEAEEMGRKAEKMPAISDQVPPTTIQKKADNYFQSVVIQRLVVNVGKSSLKDEFKKPEGWIIASDLCLALRRGGWGQEIFEFNYLPKVKLGQDENVYLIGHGAAGLIGFELSNDIAPKLNDIIPKNYKGSAETAWNRH